MKCLAIVITDSRGKHFEDLDAEQDYRDYDTIYISRSGAKIQDLILPVQQNLYPINPNRPVVVKLAAGICDITDKSKTHKGIAKITFQKGNCHDIISQFRHFRTKILQTHPKSLVSVATIPPANLVTANERAEPSTSRKKEILAQSWKQIEHVYQLNTEIIKLNYENQELGRPTTPLLCATCLKKKKGNKLVPIVSALSDGVHGTRLTQVKWLKLIHQSIKRDINKLQL